MCKIAKSHLFHIIFIFISYLFNTLSPKWRRARPGPAGPGSWPGPCRHFGSKIWNKYEKNMKIIWNKCDLPLLHIIYIFISYFCTLSGLFVSYYFLSYVIFIFPEFRIWGLLHRCCNLQHWKSSWVLYRWWNEWRAHVIFKPGALVLKHISKKIKPGPLWSTGCRILPEFGARVD